MPQKRHIVVRYPDPGPPALVGEPNTFNTLQEAEDRLQEIEAGHLKKHHTSLGIETFAGDRATYLKLFGIME